MLIMLDVTPRMLTSCNDWLPYLTSARWPDTPPTALARRRLSRAHSISSMKMRLRFWAATQSFKLLMIPKRLTENTFEPRLARWSAMYRSMPSITLTTAINVQTEMITPSSVRKERSLWLRSVSKAKRKDSLNSIISLHLFGTRPDLCLGPRGGFVLKNPAVANLNHPVGVLGNVVFMRHHNDGVALLVQAVEQRHDR